MNVNSVITLLHGQTDKTITPSYAWLPRYVTPSTYESQNTNQCQFCEKTAMSRALHNRQLLCHHTLRGIHVHEGVKLH